MFAKQTDTQLVETIDMYKDLLKETTVGTKEFDHLCDQLTKLLIAKNALKREKASTDVLLTVGANLAGIAMILGHERAHVVASKALGFVMKLR